MCEAERRKDVVSREEKCDGVGLCGDQKLFFGASRLSLVAPSGGRFFCSYSSDFLNFAV